MSQKSANKKKQVQMKKSGIVTTLQNTKWLTGKETASYLAYTVVMVSTLALLMMQLDVLFFKIRDFIIEKI